MDFADRLKMEPGALEPGTILTVRLDISPRSSLSCPTLKMGLLI